jgi:hypothetical protein
VIERNPVRDDAAEERAHLVLLARRGEDRRARREREVVDVHSQTTQPRSGELRHELFLGDGELQVLRAKEPDASEAVPSPPRLFQGAREDIVRRREKVSLQ